MPGERVRASVTLVVKLGGSLLHDAALHERARLACISLGLARSVLIVPGGGPFTDVVRDLDRRMGLGDEIAHWLAIRGMDLHAALIAARREKTPLVRMPADLPAGARNGTMVMAPHDWLRAADPLPHSWDVTSDSIAAWMARALGAERLLLVKRTDRQTERLVDPYFATARGDLAAQVVTVETLERLVRRVG